MPFVYIVAGLVVVVAIGLLAVGKLGELPDPTLDRAAEGFGESPVSEAQIDRLHFSVGLRGYRMGEVADVHDRVVRELTWRDERIAEMETTLTEHGVAFPERVVDVLADAADEPTESTVPTESDFKESSSAE